MRLCIARLLLAFVATGCTLALPAQLAHAVPFTYDALPNAHVDTGDLTKVADTTPMPSGWEDNQRPLTASGEDAGTNPGWRSVATNFGEGGPDFNQAMNEALEWLLARGFRAERPTIGKFGSTAGRPIGMQTSDGKVGFRVEFDARSGAHINVFAGKEKGPHFTFAGSEATVKRMQRLFERC